jgi:hypothetical protein
MIIGTQFGKIEKFLANFYFPTFVRTFMLHS